ncbi:MAG TPA: ATP-binding cassette domain-containing protein [Xanthobacteraceae bacterium]|jgi:branched-chain amino acid transport system ATP-binding protein
MPQKSLLRFDGVVSGYGKKEILHGVTLHVRRGETVCLTLPNGAGKSTVLLAILGYLKPKSGGVLIEGTPIHGRQTHSIVQRASARSGGIFFRTSPLANISISAGGPFGMSSASALRSSARVDCFRC